MSLRLSKKHAQKLKRTPEKKAHSPRQLATAVTGKKPARVHKQLATLKIILRSLDLEFVEEHRFHPVRMWRFDLAIPSLKVAIEYQGHGQTGRNAGTGTHIGGHATIKGLSNDCEKDLQATLLGWRVLKLTALHFDPKKRAELKLTAPLDSIKDLLSTK